MFETMNPATGEPNPPVEELDAGEVEARVARAVDRFRTWRLTPIAERAALLHRIADAFEANKDRLARTATREMGKTLKSAIAEVEKCVAGFRFYAEDGPSFLTDHEVAYDGGRATATWQPLGPVLAVMPWNFPYWQVVRFMAPTILAGNVGLLKHASITQRCAALIEEMALEAGAPEGLFQNLAVKSDMVAALIADDRIAAVTLTGSEGAGQKVAEAAGRALKKVVLELGGSDPFIVMASADLDNAAEVGAKARIQNAGQSCICAKRIIVHAAVYDAFLEKFTAAMGAARLGDPMAPDTDIGPLSSFEQRDTVFEQVSRARDQGAQLLFGAQKPDLPGAYLTPGILCDVDPDSDVAREEMFGPVAMLFRVDDLDAAVALANDVPFGLGSSIWTTDAEEEGRLVRDLQCGMVAVNQMLASVPQAPFGGIKRSGHGRELGPWGLHEFMNLKAVMRPD
ncbi:NAD-dependent succinate-semialdehyde dehydrogenase [Sphingomonas sp.]|uniref:NAD-dependent succinate-semialdehyde dehydrogenase n=1 Tax=Sphingomonas sp. TaxID=28214 RepID=UPI002CEC4AC7|nr:NAD-dependent succinate-semialdehyde dehydrogenase [Sphingomonas sp.]HTG39527.1 NAD-dependent succinate-semialdehyde dehydrogenase [Sphingomonas sp.]